MQNKELRRKKGTSSNTDQKKAGIAIQLDKTSFKAKTSTRTKRSLCFEIVADFIFFGLLKSLQMVTAAMKLKEAYSLE